jgi:hypothetical protein
MSNKDKTILIVVLVVLAVFILGGFGFGMMNYGNYHGMWEMMSGKYGFGIGLFGWIFGLLVFVALVLLIMWLVKQIRKP